MTGITQGSTTIDAGAFIDSPAKATATGLIDGAHIPQEGLVRWLREQAASRLSVTRQGAGDNYEVVRAKGKTYKEIADMIESGKRPWA